MADIDSALQILSRNNYKLTKQRKELLKYLYQFQNEYINVSQVDEFMHQLYPKMSHNTIYRNIRDFNRLGIVEMQTRQGVLQVKYQCDFDHFHHHHFICTNCGKVRELDECPMEQFERQLQDAELRVIDLRFMEFAMNACKNSKIISRYIKITF